MNIACVGTHKNWPTEQLPSAEDYKVFKYSHIKSCCSAAEVFTDKENLHHL